MLRLVVADWHVGSAIKQDVGGHQDWVVEQADGGAFLSSKLHTKKGVYLI